MNFSNFLFKWKIMVNNYITLVNTTNETNIDDKYMKKEK